MGSSYRRNNRNNMVASKVYLIREESGVSLNLL
jgi:hypothetical protein